MTQTRIREIVGQALLNTLIHHVTNKAAVMTILCQDVQQHRT